jgi:hypothetical protein
MEEQEDGWLTVLEKNGLGPAATILERLWLYRCSHSLTNEACGSTVSR